MYQERNETRLAVFDSERVGPCNPPCYGTPTVVSDIASLVALSTGPGAICPDSVTPARWVPTPVYLTVYNLSPIKLTNCSEIDCSEHNPLNKVQLNQNSVRLLIASIQNIPEIPQPDPVSKLSSHHSAVMAISNGSTSRTAGTPKCMPAPDPAPCFWQQELPQDLAELRDHRSSEQLLDYSDIVIVGAGFAGLSTAHHLVRDAGATSICILEARGICSGATGRNGGHCRPDLYGHIPTYIDRAGERAGAEIAEFEIANLRAIKKIIDEEKIDCDFTLTRSIDVWCNEDSAKKAEAVYQSMVSHNFEYMDDVVFYTGDKVEGVSDPNTSLNCFTCSTKTLSMIHTD